MEAKMKKCKVCKKSILSDDLAGCEKISGLHCAECHKAHKKSKK